MPHQAREAPFVKIGQTVSAGDTLGIIEAMKIMNPIEATQSGVIEEILVKMVKSSSLVNHYSAIALNTRGFICCRKF